MFKDKLSLIPHKPGSYQMKDKDGVIIYVGKAISLKRRVTSYFRKTKKTQRILNMVALIDHFEYIVCDNEAEALVLECNLIKKNMPKFNVLLKDDKTYPYIKINVKAKFPDVYITRRVLNDGARYFGPYPNSGAAKEMVEFIKTRFKIRQCKSFKYKDRACLNYYIKKCSGPCMGYISEADYRKRINQIISILDGNVKDVEKELKNEMELASQKMEYEKAALLRDELYAVQAISQRQKVANISDNDIDVIGFAKNNEKICVEVFYIRNSKMIGRDNFFLNGLNDEADSELTEEFIERFYSDKDILPNKIMCRNDFEDREIFEQYLTKKAGRNVEIKVPKIGEKVRLVEMAENNAKITLENKEKSHKNVIVELKDTLGLNRLPRKIESFDISNISGTYMVAGMCVMIDGQIRKNLSRRFKIKTVIGQDDPKSMEEVVTRRLRHSINLMGELEQRNAIESRDNQNANTKESNGEQGVNNATESNDNQDTNKTNESNEKQGVNNVLDSKVNTSAINENNYNLSEDNSVDDEGIKDNLLNRIDWDRVKKLPKEILQKYDGSKGFGRLPDLILADGGITQIRATKAAIRNIENEIGTTLNIEVYGMVKNDKHQTRALMDENRNEMEISEDLFNLITNFQNEVHNTAIGYHKMLRDKSMVKSELDNISGIGNVKKIELLKKFGSVENIAKASVDEIASVKGINKELAEKISKELAKKF